MRVHVFYPYFVVLLLLSPLLLYWLRRTPRRLNTGSRRLLFALRITALLLMVLGLVRLSMTQAYQRANVVFLLDMSYSMAAAAKQEALEFIRAVSGYKREQDGVGLVVFGTDALLEKDVSPLFTVPEVASEVDATATNIARAIQVGVASFPAEGARRLVLLSDGNENVSAAADAALIARSLGVEIFALPLGRPPREPEVRVEKLVAPAQVQAGSPYRVEAVVASTFETAASLELLRDGVFVGRQEVTLQPGKNRYQFPQQATDKGVQLYQIVLNSQLDTIAENNRSQAFTEVVGRAKILLLHDAPEPSEPFAAALREQGFEVQTRPWSALPQTLSGYLEYAALIFDNVPSFGISVAQMEILERYVRDMGGGLLMLGGEKSFGAGGYYRTPIEKLLPVDMDIPTKMSTPGLALVMVIDRSDSMGGNISGTASGQRLEDRTTKLDVAKIAAFSAIKLLNPFDQVGLLAFNSDWEWTVPMSEAGKREQIAGRLTALSHAGGTDLFKGLQEGLRALKEAKSVKKHLIALSDGLTPNMDFEELVRSAAAQNITITTVALGKDADRTLMDAVAHWGNGRSYYTDDAMYVPRIFTAETILVSRGLIEEQPFQPIVQSEHELLRGIDLGQAPNLHGYVVTYGKPAAEVLLVTPKSDPLLAVQRYGLGRTAAFTADLATRWGKDWLPWSQFGQFAGQLVHWLQRKGTVENFDVHVDVREGQAMIQVDVYDVQEQFVNHLDLGDSRVLVPGKQTLPVAFTHTAPGRYQGRFPVQGNGEYLLSVVGKHGNTAIGPKTVGISLPYSAEYLGLDINYGLLSRLTERTKGEILRADAPREAADLLFATLGQELSVLQDMWPWFVIAALCFFVGEIALRQITMATTSSVPLPRQSRRQQPTTETAPLPSYTYGELEALVHRRAEEHRRRSMALREPRSVAGTRMRSR